MCPHNPVQVDESISYEGHFDRKPQFSTLIKTALDEECHLSHGRVISTFSQGILANARFMWR